MSAEEVLFEAEAGMEKAGEFMMHEFNAIRTGKASPALVENIDVIAYGSSMKLKQLALITSPEPRLLVIQPFDAGTVQDIERAIQESKIGINPAVDGKLIRLRIPELSEERRKDLIKVVRAEAENSRVAIRNIRRDANTDLKNAVKDKLISEDDERRSQEQVQKLTDQFVKEVDSLLEQKEKDLLAI